MLDGWWSKGCSLSTAKGVGLAPVCLSGGAGESLFELELPCRVLLESLVPLLTAFEDFFSSSESESDEDDESEDESEDEDEDDDEDEDEDEEDEEEDESLSSLLSESGSGILAATAAIFLPEDLDLESESESELESELESDEEEDEEEDEDEDEDDEDEDEDDEDEDTEAARVLALTASFATAFPVANFCFFAMGDLASESESESESEEEDSEEDSCFRFRELPVALWAGAGVGFSSSLLSLSELLSLELELELDEDEDESFISTSELLESESLESPSLLDLSGAASFEAPESLVHFSNNSINDGPFPTLLPLATVFLPVCSATKTDFVLSNPYSSRNEVTDASKAGDRGAFFGTADLVLLSFFMRSVSQTVPICH